MTTPARIYVLYGQGGWLTSIGMWQLSQRIAQLWPTSKVTTHSWAYPSVVYNDAKRLPAGTKTIVIGYSLGADSTTLIGLYVPIDLAVCYDPSVLGEVIQPSPNIKRLLLYHNIDWEPEGHAIFTGKQVERTDVTEGHLFLDFNEALHKRTLAAIAKLIGNPTT